MRAPTCAKPETCSCDACSAERFSEGVDVIRGAEVFASGEHRGKSYTPRDIDAMVENFNRFSAPKDGKAARGPRLEVPAVIGHEEDQEFLDLTGGR